MPLLRRTKITLLQNEIVQNKPGSAIREGGSQAAGFARLEGRHAATTENSRQARSATQTDNLAQKRSRWRDDPSKILKIKNSPRHKPAFSKPAQSENRPEKTLHNLVRRTL